MLMHAPLTFENPKRLVTGTVIYLRNLALSTAKPSDSVFGDDAIHPTRDRHCRLGLRENGDPAQEPWRNRHHFHPGICGLKDFAIRLENHRLTIAFGKSGVTEQDVNHERLSGTTRPLLYSKLRGMAKIAAPIVVQRPSLHTLFYAQRPTTASWEPSDPTYDEKMKRTHLSSL